MRALIACAAMLAATIAPAIGADVQEQPHYSNQFQPLGREWNSDDSKAALKCDENMGRKMTSLSAAGNPLAQEVASGTRQGAEFWGAMMEGCLAALGRTDIKGYVVQDRL